MSRTNKKIIIILIDTLVYFSSFMLSYLILEPIITINLRQITAFLILNLIIYLSISNYLHLFQKIIRYTSIKDSIFNVLSIVTSFIISSVIILLLGFTYSLRFAFLSWTICLILIPGSRIFWRITIEHFVKRQRFNNYTSLENVPVKTLIVGAGEGGAIFVKRLMNDPSIEFVGFVDDDKSKRNTYIHSIPVLGNVKDIPRLIKEYGIEQVTIAIPSLTGEELNRIIEIVSQSGVNINQMPAIEDLMIGKYTINKFKEIDVVDLLGREEVKLDMEVISSKTTDNVILVSGAGGSIGSEICRQLIRFNPHKILLLGHGEYSIYKIHRELKQLNIKGVELIPVIADIQDRERLDEVMEKFRPDRIYHAAAHKHVPMMQSNPKEAVKNNIYGTKNIAESAKKFGVKTFVMVSTDKAVNPPNVMGATKRIAEMIVTGLNEEGKTNFVAVRFGNVLNSRGSVIPVFKEQLKRGGPLTITDFRMTRYFMTIPEASRLVLQAGALAKGGEIFVLDMGEPVKIVDLAKKIIQLSGYSVEEIGIQEVGIRPGEKLYEELLTDGEAVSKKVYEKIFVGNVTNVSLKEVMNFVNRLDSLSESELTSLLIEYANKT